MEISVSFVSFASSVLTAAGGAVQHMAGHGPMNWSINLPDAITYALFGGGLIAVAVVRRRRI